MRMRTYTTYERIYIHRKFRSNERLGWLAPARQLYSHHQLHLNGSFHYLTPSRKVRMGSKLLYRSLSYNYNTIFHKCFLFFVCIMKLHEFHLSGGKK